MRTYGLAGPSGLDSLASRRLCSSFGAASQDLCSALAAVGRHLCSSLVNPGSISAFVACHLVPLDKCSGVRPIGVGEVPRRIIAKAILRTIGKDTEEAAGPLFINTYRAPVRMIVVGSGEISSTEGTTQGDHPLAMAMYPFAILPLIHKPKSISPNVKQVWYADDATGAGTCEGLRQWWEHVELLGPTFGYHPNKNLPNCKGRAQAQG